MNNDRLKRAVVETLGFDPDVFKYELEQHKREIADIKTMLKQTIPTIGRSILELNILQEFLKQNGLDASEFIEEQLEVINKKANEVTQKVKSQKKINKKDDVH